MPSSTNQEEKPDENITGSSSTSDVVAHVSPAPTPPPPPPPYDADSSIIANSETTVTVDHVATEEGAVSTGAAACCRRRDCSCQGCEEMRAVQVRLRRYFWRRRQEERQGGHLQAGSVGTRLRNLRSRHGQWTCFFCCHVTTGTAIIGAWHVLLHLLTLSLLCVAVFYPEFVTQPRPPTTNERYLLTRQDVQAVNCTHMPCSLATQRGGGNAGLSQAAPDFPLALGHLLSTHQLNSEMVSVALFITMCTMMVTLLLLHGVRRQQPSHLMPFFFLQVFDFCISSMTLLSHLSYLPNLRQLLHDTPSFPFRQQLLAMHTTCLTFFIMLTFISTVMVKAYCISVVWRCYKYLMVCRAAAATGQTPAQLLEAGGAGTGRCTASNPGPEHCMQWLQQDYRSKASGAYPEPPPSYDTAMANLLGAQATSQSASVPEGGEDDAPLLPRYEDAVRDGGATAASTIIAGTTSTTVATASTVTTTAATPGSIAQVV